MDQDNSSAAPTIVGSEADRESYRVDDIFKLIHLFFGIFGLAGNGLVLVVMIRVRSLRSITNLFITNQSVIDFMSSVFLIVFFYLPGHDSDYSDVGFNPWTSFLCHVWFSHYIFWAMLGCSTANLMILTLERYISVVYPILYRNQSTKKVVAVFTILPWIVGFLFEAYWPAFHVKVHGFCYPDFRSRALQAIIGVIIFVVKIFGPVLVMFAVYLSIFKKMNFRFQVGPVSEPVENRRENHLLSANRGPGLSATDGHVSTTAGSGSTDTTLFAISKRNGDTATNRHRQHRGAARVEATGTGATSERMRVRLRLNILKTLFIVTVVFTICWSPTAIFFLLYNLGFQFDIPNGTPYKILAVIVFVNIWINPVIYTFKYRRFQEGLKKTFRCAPRS